MSPDKRNGPAETGPLTQPNPTSEHPSKAPDVCASVAPGAGLTPRSVLASSTRGWWAGQWWDPPEVGLSDVEREREIARLVGDGWSIGEALAAVQAPSYWPADDPGRDLDSNAERMTR